MRLPNYDGYTIPYVNLSCALGGVSVCVCVFGKGTKRKKGAKSFSDDFDPLRGPNTHFRNSLQSHHL